MTVFLTPELKPFFGGTYFPPTSRWGRPGFPDLLGELARVWKDDRPRVEQAAAELLERLKTVTGAGGHGRGEVDAGRRRGARRRRRRSYAKAFDARHGGFGDAPKFPRPSELLFLLREHARRDGRGRPEPGAAADGDRARCARWRWAACAITSAAAFIATRSTPNGACRTSRRCSTTRRSSSLAYLEAAQATGDDFYAAVAEDTLAYVLRDLTDPEGGFYSAEDADSVPPEHAGRSAAHKMRGRLLHLDRRRDRAAARRATPAIVRRRFGIEPSGNAPQDPQGEFTRQEPPLHRAVDRRQSRSRAGRPPEVRRCALARARGRPFRRARSRGRGRTSTTRS